MTGALRVLDLFSGIGGFSLGLERTGGFETVAFCEIDPFCRRVLAKHWPDVPIYEDVRTLTADALSRDGIAVDVICGGFPCQDVSNAGRRAGLAGARSGLWSEYRRLVGELRPRFVIVENVPGLLSLGMGDVLGDLAALGFDAEWHCIPAAAVGAPHIRDRVWIIANAQHPHTDSLGSYRAARDVRSTELRDQQGGDAGQVREDVADAQRGESGKRRNIDKIERRAGEAEQAWVGSSPLADADSQRHEVGLDDRRGQDKALGSKFARREASQHDWWDAEPDVGRVAHGVPSRVDRLRALGNAVVPQIPELIGRAILEAEGLTP